MHLPTYFDSVNFKTASKENTSEMQVYDTLISSTPAQMVVRNEPLLDKYSMYCNG